MGALVLRWGSIWPGVVLYTLMNLIPIIPTDFTHTLYTRDPMMVFVRLSLFELPLVLFGIWLLLRVPPHPMVGERPTREFNPPTDQPPMDPLMTNLKP
jgi:hypothetical protein